MLDHSLSAISPKPPLGLFDGQVFAFGGTTPYVVTWLTAETGNSVAPAYYVVVAAIVSLLTILTIRETAGRPIPQRAADETFQSDADVEGAATTGKRRR